MNKLTEQTIQDLSIQYGQSLTNLGAKIVCAVLVPTDGEITTYLHFGETIDDETLKKMHEAMDDEIEYANKILQKEE